MSNMDNEHTAILSFLELFPSVTIPPSLSNDSTEEDLATYLHNGVILFDALSDIAPYYFDSSSITRDPKDNYILKQSNLRKLLRNLRIFVRDEQRKKILLPTDDTQHLISTIVKDRQWESILFLLELIAATAVTCDQRATFVGGIRGMTSNIQLILKDLIKRGLDHLQEFEKSEDDEPVDDLSQDFKEDATIGLQSITPSHRRRSISGGDGDLTLDTESVFADTFDAGSSPYSWTLEEREEYSSITKASLFKERNALRQQLEDMKKEYVNFKSQSENFYENTDYAQKKLRANADDLHDRLEKREEELAALEVDYTKMKRALDDAELKLADSTEKCAILADELDVANAKAAQLLRAEATVAVYRKRLEGIGAMGQQISELEDQNAKYVRQIEELEVETKRVSEVTKNLEELQRDWARSEKEKLDAMQSLTEKASLIQTLKANLSAAENAKRMYESALKELRSQQEQEETLDSELRPVVNKIQPHVLPPEMIQQMEKLELENSTLKQQMEEIQKRVLSNGSAVAVQEIQCLHQEVAALNELLDQKDEQIQKLIIDREKLETYTKNTLSKFQEKYLSALQECKTKLKEKHEKILDLELKIDSDKAVHKREEKLMSSAVYELGLAIMQAKLKEKY